jgi:peptide/nickel transport system substrate-binding protein
MPDAVALIRGMPAWPWRRLVARVLLAACAASLLVPAVHAQTVRVANQGDLLSLDPHSNAEALQLSLTQNVYEPLVGRDKTLGLMPLLATRWREVGPSVWRFELRRGVRFHDGRPFTADDVVFSLARAASEGSDLRIFAHEIREARRVDDFTVDIETRAPYPILPEVLSQLAIMSRSWCEEQQALRPSDSRRGLDNAASRRANGTGPFTVRERQPGVRTVFARHDGYWGAVEGNVREVVFTPIASDATRVAALLSGEVDVMEPVPVQDIERLQASSRVRAVVGPELRTIFLGMDQWRDELPQSDVLGRNPFKDKRVRQAFYQAMDIDAIQKSVMRGASRPTGLMVGPGVNGWSQAQDQRLPHDTAAARRLLAEAGYPQGFSLTLNCPNDRYVNDSQICQAVAAQLARVGVRVNLAIEPKATYFPRVLRRDTGFYLFGWVPSTYDAHNVLDALMRCPDEQGAGQFNLGRYCNPALDAITLRVRSETDRLRRDTLIREAFALHAADIGHLPLHQQSLAWGVSRQVELVQLSDNGMPFKWISIRR